MAVTCTSDNLATLAACFTGMSPVQMEAVKIYLLAVQAGVDPDPAALAEAAKCLFGLSPAQQKAIQVYLLCQIANSTSPSETAISLNNLNSLASNALADTYTITEFQPSPNAVVFMAIGMENTQTISSIVGNGITWTLVASRAYLANTRIIYLYRGLAAAPTRTTCVITLTGVLVINGLTAHVLELTNVNTSGTNGSGAVVQSGSAANANVTLAALNASGRNAIVGFTSTATIPSDCDPKLDWFQDANLSGFGASGNSLGVSHQLLSTDNAYQSGAAGTSGSIAVEVGVTP